MIFLPSLAQGQSVIETSYVVATIISRKGANALGTVRKQSHAQSRENDFIIQILIKIVMKEKHRILEYC